MIKTGNPEKPLWVKIFFETPELIYDLLLMGMFPGLRKSTIDFFIKILIYCEQKRESFKMFEQIKSTTLNLIEWVNNNWTKKFDQ